METDLEAEIARTRQGFEDGKTVVRTPAEFASFRNRFVAKKTGALPALFKLLGAVPAPDRPRVGALLNELKIGIESSLEALGQAIEQREREAALERERIDVTLTGRRPARGSLHPTTRARLAIESIFRA